MAALAGSLEGRVARRQTPEAKAIIFCVTVLKQEKQRQIRRRVIPRQRAGIEARGRGPTVRLRGVGEGGSKQAVAAAAGARRAATRPRAATAGWAARAPRAWPRTGAAASTASAPSAARPSSRAAP